jgi:uncharacterized membrane protein
MSGCWIRPTVVTWWAVASALVMTGATAAYLASIYSSLPIGVPVQYVMDRPYIFERKSPVIVMLPVLVQSGLLAVFGMTMLLLLWRPRPATAGASDRSEADTARMRLAAEGIALLAAIWIAIQTLGAVRLMVLWRGAWGGFGQIYSLAVIVAIVVSVIVMVRTMRLVARQRKHVRPDNPAVWRLRHLYFNPGDPALFVQTRTGIGWTLNFGRPIAIVLLASTLLMGVGGPWMLARYILRGSAL